MKTRARNTFTRRRFLLLLGAGGIAGTVPWLSLLNRPAQAKEPQAGEAREKKTIRQWAMAVDLRKCEGCITIGQPPQCTQACIQNHYVPEGQQWIQVFEKELEGGGKFFMPTPCYQCENAPCVNVCPVGATYHTPEGIVLIDNSRCIGCRLCLAACPYQRRFFNWGEPELPAEAHFIKSTPEFPIAKRGTSIKCVFCAHNLSVGKLPFCVEGCPMGALYLGDLNEDMATNGREIVKFSTFLSENNAYRYKEELGTQPRVFYIPGHGQVFGRKAHDHREKKPNSWPWVKER